MHLRACQRSPATSRLPHRNPKGHAAAVCRQNFTPEHLDRMEGFRLAVSRHGVPEFDKGEEHEEKGWAPEQL
eukprot:762434-Hanusia_phi.AAC.5